MSTIDNDSLVSRGFLAIVLEKLGKSTGEAIDNRMEKKLQRLELQIQELQRKSIEFLGVFVDGELYQKNSLVQRSGSLWIALRSTHEVPGKSADWRLCVKNGGLRDA